jgi:hypothetical protein
VSSTPADGVFIEIEGRPAGLMGWVLTKIGLDSEQLLKVTKSELVLDAGGLQGRHREMTPMSGIASTSVGYTKSVWTLLSGLVILAWGLFRGIAFDSKFALISGVIVGGVLLVKYWLSKRLHVAVETTGGRFIGVPFKRSIIENVTVDFEKCSSVVDVIRQLILESQWRREVRVEEPEARAEHGTFTKETPSQPATGVGRFSGVASAIAAPRKQDHCPKCGARVEPASRFCEQCGTGIAL